MIQPTALASLLPSTLSPAQPSAGDTTFDLSLTALLAIAAPPVQPLAVSGKPLPSDGTIVASEPKTPAPIAPGTPDDVVPALLLTPATDGMPQPPKSAPVDAPMTTTLLAAALAAPMTAMPAPVIGPQAPQDDALPIEASPITMPRPLHMVGAGTPAPRAAPKPEALPTAEPETAEHNDAPAFPAGTDEPIDPPVVAVAHAPTDLPQPVPIRVPAPREDEAPSPPCPSTADTAAPVSVPSRNGRSRLAVTAATLPHEDDHVPESRASREVPESLAAVSPPAQPLSQAPAASQRSDGTPAVPAEAEPAAIAPRASLPKPGPASPQLGAEPASPTVERHPIAPDERPGAEPAAERPRSRQETPERLPELATAAPAIEAPLRPAADAAPNPSGVAAPAVPPPVAGTQRVSADADPMIPVRTAAADAVPNTHGVAASAVQPPVIADPQPVSAGTGPAVPRVRPLAPPAAAPAAPADAVLHRAPSEQAVTPSAPTQPAITPTSSAIRTAPAPRVDVKAASSLAHPSPAQADGDLPARRPESSTKPEQPLPSLAGTAATPTIAAGNEAVRTTAPTVAPHGGTPPPPVPVVARAAPAVVQPDAAKRSQPAAETPASAVPALASPNAGSALPMPPAAAAPTSAPARAEAPPPQSTAATAVLQPSPLADTAVSQTPPTVAVTGKGAALQSPSARTEMQAAQAAIVQPAALPGLLPLVAGTTAPAFRVFAAAIHAAQSDERERPVLLATTPLSTPVEQTAGPIAAAAQGTPLDMTDRRWPHAMVAHIERLQDAAGAARDAASTSIRLVPDALGTVDVSLRTQGDTVHVHFTAEQPATRTLIADAQPRLIELAEARGIKLAQSNVSGGSDGGQRQQPPVPQPQTGRAPAPAPRDDEPETATTRIA